MAYNAYKQMLRHGRSCVDKGVLYISSAVSAAKLERNASGMKPGYYKKHVVHLVDLGREANYMGLAKLCTGNYNVTAKRNAYHGLSSAATMGLHGQQVYKQGIPQQGLGNQVTTPEKASVPSRALHFNMFGGNPVCPAGGQAVLRLLERGQGQQHRDEVGTYFIQRLNDLKGKHEIIGDVKGKRLMIGVELVVRDGSTKEPAKKETAHLYEKMKDLGEFIGKGGMYGNILWIKLPKCFFSKDDADFLVDVMDYTIAKMQLDKEDRGVQLVLGEEFS